MLPILLTLCLWGATTDGAPQAGAAPQSRPALPPGVKASDYVDAVVRLHGMGRSAEAGPYLKAAYDYRDQLTEAQRATLDRYAALVRGASAPMPTPSAPHAATPTVDPRTRAVALVASARQAAAAGQVEEARRLALEAQSLGVPFAATEDSPARLLSDLQRQAAGPLGRAGGASAKQQATWLLKSAREQIALGNFDQASQYLAQAQAMNVRWTLFDDTPSKVEADLVRLRGQAPAVASAPAVGDRRDARTKLKEARAALESGDVDRAEAIATEVANWRVHMGALEDNPNKVLAACRVVRRRNQSRRGGSAITQSEDLYNTLVAEARQLQASGRLDEAEARARQAQQMNVVPSLAADRAEAILADVATARAAAMAKVDPALQTVSAESPSQALEREANALLAQNQLAAARAKFEEAERMRAQEAGLAGEVAPALLDASGGPSLAGPAATADPFAEVAQAAPAEAPGLAQVPGALSNSTDALGQAAALLAAGNYAAAREMAQQAKAAGVSLEADNLLAQIAQTQQQASLALYEAALTSIRKGESDRARALLSELASEELDESLQQKVQDLLMKLPQDGSAPDAMKAVEDAEAIKAQQLNAEVGTRVAEARRLLETDPAKAIELLNTTKVSIQNAGLSEAVARTMLRRVDVAIELAKKDKVAFDEKMKDKAFREEIERKRLRMIEYDKEKKARYAEYMEKAQEAQARSDWVEAEKYAKLAAEIDPNEVAATALATVARVRRHYDRDLQLREESNASFLANMQGVSESGIVSPDLLERGIAYDKGFAALTERRRALADRLAPKKSARVLEIESVLNKPVTLPNSDQMTLGEAIKYLSEYSGINIVPDAAALAEEGLTLNSPVNITAVNNVKLKSVLKYMLSPLRLSYVVEDEVLLITSPQANKSRMYPVVYSVADLVISAQGKSSTINAGLPYVAPPGQNQADPNLLQAQAAAMTGQPMAALAPSNGTGQGTGERQVDFQPLIQLIKSSIAPGTWSDDHTPLDQLGGAYGQGGGGGGAGGGAAEPQGVGSITPFFLNISLIIRQTAEVHEEIVDLLRQLRRLQDLQVSIEVRFITVSDSFFELIGVDFDFAIHSDAVGRKSSFAVPNPAVFPFPGQTTGGGGATANTAVQPYLINPIRDHAYGREPLVVGTQGPTNNLNTPNFNPNLMLPFTNNTIDAITPFNIVPNVTSNFGVAFLSDLEVYFFMTAIQGDIRSNLVQAPKVTSFNGAPAFVSNFTGRNFVSSLQPVLGAGAVAFQPQIQTFPDGVQLFVTPVVSADRRYVRMSLSPIFTTFLQFDNFVIPAAVGGGGLGGQSSTVNAQVQLPVFTITQLFTTVTVPDGGTVLLGGVKRLREERREFGVPVLAKTPMINRLFRNVGIGRTTDSLMVMVTPRIIILEEEEEKLGVPAIQNVTF
jgi:type II secretory pathway component GspD/PulD (secretin)